MVATLSLKEACNPNKKPEQDPTAGAIISFVFLGIFASAAVCASFIALRKWYKDNLYVVVEALLDGPQMPFHEVTLTGEELPI